MQTFSAGVKEAEPFDTVACLAIFFSLKKQTSPTWDSQQLDSFVQQKSLDIWR